MVKTVSSESVTEGHPDKVCDYIADSILDAALEKDADSRIACEVCVATGLTVVLGEFDTATDFIDVQAITSARVRRVDLRGAQRDQRAVARYFARGNSGTRKTRRRVVG